MKSEWLEVLNKDEITRNWETFDETTKQEIKGYIEEYRPRFEEELYEKQFPMHPYKIMMQIRKEKGLTNGKERNRPKLVRALKILMQEYMDEWQEMCSE